LEEDILNTSISKKEEKRSHINKASTLPQAWGCEEASRGLDTLWLREGFTG